MTVSTHQPALQERFLLVLSFVRACRKWPPCRREGFWALTIPSLLTPSIFHSGICRRIRGKDTPVFLGFPGGSAGKESAYNARDLDSIPGLRRSPGEGKGYLLLYSGLENAMDCRVHGVAKSGTWLSDLHFHFQEKRNQEFLLGSQKLASSCQGLRTLNSYYLFPCFCYLSTSLCLHKPPRWASPAATLVLGAMWLPFPASLPLIPGLPSIQTPSVEAHYPPKLFYRARVQKAPVQLLLPRQHLSCTGHVVRAGLSTEETSELIPEWSEGASLLELRAERSPGEVKDKWEGSGCDWSRGREMRWDKRARPGPGLESLMGRGKKLGVIFQSPPPPRPPAPATDWRSKWIWIHFWGWAPRIWF